MLFTLNGTQYRVRRKTDKTFHLANFVYRVNNGIEELVFVDFSHEGLRDTMMFFIRQFKRFTPGDFRVLGREK